VESTVILIFFALEWASESLGHMSGRSRFGVHFQSSYNLCVSTDFLDRLANQLRANKSAACGRAFQRILAVVKKNCEEGKYRSDVEAEAAFRYLVDRDESCE